MNTNGNNYYRPGGEARDIGQYNWQVTLYALHADTQLHSIKQSINQSRIFKVA